MLRAALEGVCTNGQEDLLLRKQQFQIASLREAMQLETDQAEKEKLARKLKEMLLAVAIPTTSI